MDQAAGRRAAVSPATETTRRNAAGHTGVVSPLLPAAATSRARCSPRSCCTSYSAMISSATAMATGGRSSTVLLPSERLTMSAPASTAFTIAQATCTSLAIPSVSSVW